MKKTEQRWMHISTGLLVERGRKPDNSANDYRTVTVTWDEPEYEEVEVVVWALVYDDGSKRIFDSEPNLVIGQKHADSCGLKSEKVEIKGTYRRRKPEPEPEAVERPVVDNTGWTGCVIDLPHEWIDKRVRVEVVE